MDLDNEQIKKQEEEKWRFEPLPGNDCDLEILEEIAKTGIRISCVEPNARQSLLKKYGNMEALNKRFNDEVGYMDKADAVNKAMRKLAEEMGVSFVEDSIIVLDNKGENGKVRAYTWPFIGLKNPIVTTQIPENSKVVIMDMLKELDVDQKRFTELNGTPGVQTQRDATALVFIGHA